MTPDKYSNAVRKRPEPERDTPSINKAWVSAARRIRANKEVK